MSVDLLSLWKSWPSEGMPRNGTGSIPLFVIGSGQALSFRGGGGVNLDRVLCSSAHPGTFIGQGIEVFDAELLGVVQALQVATKAGDQRPNTILLDSQARDCEAGAYQARPGPSAGDPSNTIAKELQAQDRQLTIKWACGRSMVMIL